MMAMLRPWCRPARLAPPAGAPDPDHCLVAAPGSPPPPAPPLPAPEACSTGLAYASPAARQDVVRLVVAGAVRAQPAAQRGPDDAQDPAVRRAASGSPTPAPAGPPRGAGHLVPRCRPRHRSVDPPGRTARTGTNRPVRRDFTRP